MFNRESGADIRFKISDAGAYGAKRSERARQRPALRQRPQLRMSKSKMDVTFLTSANQHGVAPDAGEHRESAKTRARSLTNPSPSLIAVTTR